MHAMSLSPGERGHWERNSDYESELGLRCLSPPLEAAKADVKRYLVAVREIVGDIESDRALRGQLIERLADGLQFFGNQRQLKN